MFKQRVSNRATGYKLQATGRLQPAACSWRGQSTIELVLLIACIVIGFFGMWHAMRGAMVGYWRNLSGGEALYAPAGRTSGTELLAQVVERTDTFESVECDPDTEHCGKFGGPTGGSVEGNEVTRFTTRSDTVRNDMEITVDTHVSETYDTSQQLFK